MPRQLQAGLFFLPFGLAVGYVLATALAGQQLRLPVGYGYLLREFAWLWEVEPDLSVQVLVVLGASAVGAFAFGAHFANEKLTTLGTSSWQSLREMRRNGLLGEPGRGFVLAKTTAPGRAGRYITSDEHPNCLVVAPTGAGKGVGFVYPTLLTFEGSTVTLDIKGENYATTARTRAAMGDKVYKFAPVQFGEPSYRYNPLERIGKLKSYSAITFELRKIATLFLQADAAGEWLNGAIQLFTVAGGVAHERGTFTLGGIYDVLAEGDASLKSHLAALGKAAREPSLAKELASLAKLEHRTLSSYMSVLNNAGFDLWSNPHIATMTGASDFSFADLRRERASIYFVVADGDLKPLAGLVRLFFNELVATMQTAKPGKDEPHPFMLILDEFHRLGKMTDVANAMTTIRGFNGRIAIITQTIPKLEAIYSYEERLSIQGGAGLKLYMTPSEEMTIEDLSKACGMTTKRTVSKSRAAGLFERPTVTERTEERPLLTEDEARRLPPDTSIIIVNGKQPVKVRRIVHYEDPVFTALLAKQDEKVWDRIDNALRDARMNRFEEDRAKKRTPAAVPEAAPVEVAGPPEARTLTTDDLAQLKDLIEQVFQLFDQIRELPAAEDEPTPMPAAAVADGVNPSDGAESAEPDAGGTASESPLQREHEDAQSSDTPEDDTPVIVKRKKGGARRLGLGSHIQEALNFPPATPEQLTFDNVAPDKG